MSNGPAGGPALSDRQRLHWLRLIRTPNVGPVSFRELVNRFGSAEKALEALPDLVARGGARRMPRIPSHSEAEAELDAAAAMGARFAAIGEADYPPMMRVMEAPPPLIAVKGRGEVLAMTSIAIVGARNASVAGVRIARMLATDFGRADYGVASGLARGIDTAAHVGSIDSGTIAVLAGGLDKPYPPENRELFDRIGRDGAVISEMPFGWEPRAKDFPRRNRLIAGLGLGLVVVEAAMRSGSLISARLANEMGRSVFAVPGSPLDPRSQGCNRLIRDGATLIQNADDVLEALAPQRPGVRRLAPPASLEEPSDGGSPADASESDRSKVIEALGQTPVAVDEIIHHTGLRPAQVAMILLELDLAGRLERHAGGAVSLLFPHP